MPVHFQTGRKYSRADVREEVGLARNAVGGAWFTGIVEHDSEFFIFANVGTAARTGHDYQNRWDGDFLRWYHKRGSDVRWHSVQRLLRSGTAIHLFSRSADRDNFEYHGYAIPVEVVERSSPVEVLLAITKSPPQSESLGHAEIEMPSTYVEGSPRAISTTRFERNPMARAACIDYYGAKCAACDLSFADRYGPEAKGYIHVHHLVPISRWGIAYQIDPVKDMRPMCPNCHAMVHDKTPPRSIEYVREMILRNEKR